MDPKLTRPDYAIVIVSDLDRSIAFYRDILGLELKHRSGPFAQFETGATRFALYEREAMSKTLGISLRAPEADAPGFEIGFLVEDCDAMYQTLVDRGATALTPPADRPWGQRTAYVRDPDGHLVELAQQYERD